MYMYVHLYLYVYLSINVYLNTYVAIESSLNKAPTYKKRSILLIHLNIFGT